MAGGVGAQAFVVAPESTAGFTVGTPSVTTFAAFVTGRPLWPSDLAGLQLWLPADQIQGIASGTSLSLWTDSSASAAHMQQSSAVSQLQYIDNVRNGLSAVSDGAGTASLMTSSTSVLATSTIAVVCSTLSHNLPQTIFGSVNGTPKVFNNGTGFCVADGATLVGSFSTANQWVSIVAIVNGSSTTLSVSGTTVSGNAGTTAGGVTATLASAAQSSQTWTGFIGEVCYYNRNLDDTERSQLESYFRQKWAL